MLERNRRLIVVLLVGGALIVASLGWSVLKSYTGISDLSRLFTLSLDELTAEVSVPGIIPVGSTFEMTVVISNSGDDFLEIDEVQLPNSLLENAEVEGLFPGSNQARKHRNTTGYTVDLLVGPGESIELTFVLRANSAADVTDQVKVSSGLRSMTTEAHVVIGGGSDPSRPRPAGDSSSIQHPSVVKITALYLVDDQLIPGWSGSGTVITPDGLIMTSARLVLPDKYFHVDALMVSITSDPDLPAVDSYYAEVLQADRFLDLAILRVTTDLSNRPVERSELSLIASPVGNSDGLTAGSSLRMAGYPGTGEGKIAVVDGQVTGFAGQQQIGDRALIYTSEALPGEFRGGMVADRDGSLVAVPSQVGLGSGEDAIAGCGALVDTNRDGEINDLDACIPSAGVILYLRPIALALPMIDAALRGEENITQPPALAIPVPQINLVLYSEDFSNPASGWTASASTENSIGYKNTEYLVRIGESARRLTGRAGQTFDDVIITVRARLVTPATDGEYGVLCRIQDESNFYAMSFTEEGYVSIWKLVGNRLIPLLPWFRSAAVPKYEPARITAACVGTQLTLAVNGTVLGQVTDETFTSGDVGLFAGTWVKDYLAIVFDDFQVGTP